MNTHADFIVFLIVWFTPFATIFMQKAPSIGDKIFWLITAVFFSWLALIARFVSEKFAMKQ